MKLALVLTAATVHLLQLTAAERPETWMPAEGHLATEDLAELHDGSDSASSKSPAPALWERFSQPLSTAASMVMLSSRGTSQIAPAVPPAPVPPHESLMEGRPSREEAVGQVSGAFVEVSDPKPSSPSGDCLGKFGALNPQMTVIGLDPPGGCTPGKMPETIFANFVGGPDADCQAPVTTSGCYRFVVSRYNDLCDLDPLKSSVGQELATAGSQFDRQGIYSKCNTAPLLRMSTQRYIGIDVDNCNEAFCSATAGNLKKSAAPRIPPLWVHGLFAIALVLRSI